MEFEKSKYVFYLPFPKILETKKERFSGVFGSIISENSIFVFMSFWN